jgi:hypothetical protein
MVSSIKIIKIVLTDFAFDSTFFVKLLVFIFKLKDNTDALKRNFSLNSQSRKR